MDFHQGGQIEEWLSGQSLTLTKMNDTLYRSKIARTLARLHSVPIIPEIQQSIESEYKVVFESGEFPIFQQFNLPRANFSLQLMNGCASSLWPKMFAWIQECRSLLRSDPCNPRVKSCSSCNIDAIEKVRFCTPFEIFRVLIYYTPFH